MKVNIRRIIILILVTAILAAGLYWLFSNPREGIRYGLDLRGGYEAHFIVESVDGEDLTEEQFELTGRTIANRAEILGLKDHQINLYGDDEISIKFPNMTNNEEIMALLTQGTNLTFRDYNDNLLMTSDVLFTGAADVFPGGNGNPGIGLWIEDIERFEAVTEDIAGRADDNFIVLWMDFIDGEDTYTDEEQAALCGTPFSNCLNVVGVHEAFSHGVVLEGEYTDRQARLVAEFINSGDIGTRILEVSATNFNATIGHNATSELMTIGAFSLLAIILLLIILYHFSGFITALALVMHVSLATMVFWLLGASLTFPAIAALVLSISFGLHFTISVFEKIAKQMRTGTGFSVAIKNSIAKLRLSNIDAHLALFVAGAALFIMGSNATEQFGLALMITTSTSAAIFVYLNSYLISVFASDDYFNGKPRFLIGYNDRKKANKLANFRFISKSKIIFIACLLILVIGGIFTYQRGFNLGVDFTGGSHITIHLEEPVNARTIRNELNNLGVDEISLSARANSYEIRTPVKLDLANELGIIEHFEEVYNAFVMIRPIQDMEATFFEDLQPIGIAILSALAFIMIRYKLKYTIAVLLTITANALLITAIIPIFNLEITSLIVTAIMINLSFLIYHLVNTMVRTQKKIATKKPKDNEALMQLIDAGITRSLFTTILSSLVIIIPAGFILLSSLNLITSFAIIIILAIVVSIDLVIGFNNVLLYNLLKKRTKKKKLKKR